VAVVYTVFRLAVHGVYLAVMLSPGLGQLPGWVDVERPMVPVDLQVYLDAAEHFQQRQDLYLESLESIEYHFPYPPSYALAFIPFLWLSPVSVSVVHTLLHIGAYLLLYVQWNRIFKQFELKQASEMAIWTLPVWLVFSHFWNDLGYLNIYIIMALLSTLLINAILSERLGWSLLWLSIILQTKPMWAFATAVPLLLGQHRFFLKLAALAALVYAIIIGVTVIVAGPTYGWQQYADYIHLLTRLGKDFPWRTFNSGFLGYNHSIKQIVIYFLGESTRTRYLAIGVKILLLSPLATVATRYILNPLNRPGYEVPQVSLDLTFALYLGAFIWLDIVWEVSLGIAIFPYLLGTLKQKWARVLAGATLLPYALLDPLRVGSLALIPFGIEVIAPGPYILTDPNIYVPLMMIVILTFYALLIKRLWITLLASQEIGKNSYGI
jgi:hypothetical protein